MIEKGLKNIEEAKLTRRKQEEFTVRVRDMTDKFIAEIVRDEVDSFFILRKSPLRVRKRNNI